MALWESALAGEFVWIEGLRGGVRVRRYGRVLRRTRTQFVMEDEFRSRFRRADGTCIGGLHDCIVGLATVAEIAAYDLEKAAKDAREKELRAEESSLRKLFAGHAVELIRRDALYSICFGSATPAQVRAAFAAYKGAR